MALKDTSQNGTFLFITAVIVIFILKETQMFGIILDGNYYTYPSPGEGFAHTYDRDRNTCFAFNHLWYYSLDDYEYIHIHFFSETSYNVKNAKLFLKTHATDGEEQKVTIVVFSENWPYQKRMLFQQLSEEIHIPIISETRTVTIYIFKYKWQKIDISVCEFEIYGCASNHTGESCKPCGPVEECTHCNVVDGSCDRCISGLSGAKCTKRLPNVAYKRKASLSGRTLSFDYGFFNPNITDGDVSTCEDIEGRNGSVSVNVYLDDIYNITEIKVILTKLITGDANTDDYSVRLEVNKYSAQRYEYHYQNSNSISDIIRVPVNQTTSLIQIQISQIIFTAAWHNKTIYQICDVEVYGCKDDSCIYCDIQNCGICGLNRTFCYECSNGYTSPALNCTEECVPGTFGKNCSQTCGACANNTCNHVTGVCGSGCQPGWTGRRCNEGFPNVFGCIDGTFVRIIGPKENEPDYVNRKRFHSRTGCDAKFRITSICAKWPGSVHDSCIWRESALCRKFENVNTSFCVDWVPAQIQVRYHRMYWKTEIVLKNGRNETRYDPAVGLICEFSPDEDETLQYEIQWFIENENIFLTQTVQDTNRSLAVLTAHDMITAKKKAGTLIHCTVGAKRAIYERPCLATRSSQFFAGIKTSSQHITLERKGTAHLGLEMTIPYADESLEIDGVELPASDLNVFVTVPGYNLSDCRGGVSIRECEVKIKGYKFSEREKYDTEEWKQNHTFPIYSHDTDGYVINDHMTIQITTGVPHGKGSKIFSKISIGKVQVNVIEPETHWKGKTCSERTDPHMFSFDGKAYECHMDGDFVLYRNEKHLQEIQTRHHLCSKEYNNGPQCVCAVVFRAGRDVFIFNMCEGTESITFAICEDNAIQVKKVDDKNYKIYFPTGTIVSLGLMEWPKGRFHIDLEITPSLLDVGYTKGLCGTLDNNINNDFLRRDSSVDDINQRYPDDFSRSWQIQDKENLFLNDSNVYGNLSSISSIRVKQCTCVNGHSMCSYNTFTPCSFKPGKTVLCSKSTKHNRRKRDTTGYFSRKKRTVSTNVTSYEEAKSKCSTAFDESAAYSTCQQYVTDLTNTSIENCILDIMMTGDENITKIHVEAALQQCTTFVQLNATLQEAEPAVTYQIRTLCPNNCSDHGYCNEGNCSCSAGFAGSDCSFDLLGPPSISNIPRLCDSSSEDCSAITIIGKYFLENMATTCYISVRQKNINESLLNRKELKNGLQERTLFEGYCPISYETEKRTWLTEVHLNISNDDVQFTSNYKVLVYQSTCQDLHNETGKAYFTLKDQYCFISNMCLKHGNISSNGTCLYCDTSKDQYDWSMNNDCMQASTERETTSQTTEDVITKKVETASSEAEGLQPLFSLGSLTGLLLVEIINGVNL